MSEHIVSSYDEDIRNLQGRVVTMGGMVEKIWSDAMHAALTKDEEKALSVVNDDKGIDDVEAEIYSISMQLLALRSPVASDLRVVVSAMRMATVLERLGDHAKNVARREKLINPEEHTEVIRLIRSMFEISLTALQQSINAYRQLNLESARKIRENDARVDNLFDTTVSIVLKLMEPKTPAMETEALASLLFIAKSLERMGDMTTNIAEIIIFQKTGAFPADERSRGPAHGGLIESQSSGNQQ